MIVFHTGCGTNCNQGHCHQCLFFFVCGRLKPLWLDVAFVCVFLFIQQPNRCCKRLKRSSVHFWSNYLPFVVTASAVQLKTNAVVFFFFFSCLSIAANDLERQKLRFQKCETSEFHRCRFAPGDDWKLFLLTLCGWTQVAYYDRADLCQCYAGGLSSRWRRPPALGVDPPAPLVQPLHIKRFLRSRNEWK